MIKGLTQSIFKNLAPRRLSVCPKFNFATDPFNNPYGNKVRQQEISQQIKTSEFVTRNVGLQKFISRTYNTTALGVMGALGSAYVATTIPALMMNPMATAVVGGITAIASLIGVQFMRPTIINENENGVPGSIWKTQNPISRLMLYGLGVASLGVSASPIFLYMQALSPSIIPSALAISLGLFGGASAVAYTMPKDKMLGYGRVFMGSLVGLIAMQLVGLGSAYFMGPNALSTLLFNLDNYLGILLFSGLIAYDTHVAINQYENGNPDHLGMSVQLLLDFWNLLLRIMQILSKFKD